MISVVVGSTIFVISRSATVICVYELTAFF